MGKVSMQFEARTIKIKTSSRNSEIKAMVHASGFAYHRVPEGTVIHKLLPEAWMVSNGRGSSEVCNPLPMDEETARKLVCYLAEHPEARTEEYEKTVGGQWAYLPS